jgi:hypothetical protein
MTLKNICFTLSKTNENMKPFQLFVLLVFSFAFFSLSGQNYEPLIRANTFWDDTGYDIESGPCGYLGLRRYEFGGDTLIAGQGYQKILAYNFEPVNSPVFCPPFWVNPVGYTITYAFLREDPDQEQVFIWDAFAGASGEEYLLYDFSLEVGDTLFSDYMEINAKEVIEVDSIQLETGDWRKRIFLDGEEELFYIEGIGSNLGLFREMDFPIGIASQLLCVRENGMPLWGTRCGPEFVTSTHEVNAAEISIFPNPAKEQVTLRSESDQRIYVDLYYVEGSLQLTTSGLKELSITTDNLPAGIYWLKVRSEAGALIWVEKMLLLGN